MSKEQKAFLLYHDLLGSIIALEYQRDDVLSYLKQLIIKDAYEKPQLRDAMLSLLEICSNE